MLNKKGFTIVEVVITFTFVVILLTSMFTIVINYQNKTEKEQIKSNLIIYKNSVLEAVYQDIISSDMESITKCDGKDNCIKINTKTDSYVLERGVDGDGNVYLNYRDTKYVLPDSKNELSTIDTFKYDSDNENGIYKVDIPVIHAELDEEENKKNVIEIVVSGKEFDKDVTKLSNPIKVIGNDLVYNGSNQNLITVSNAKGDVYYSLTESLNASNYNIKGTKTLPNVTNAGTYVVYYYVVGNNDYKSKTGSIQVVIEKLAVTFTADSETKEFDRTPLDKKSATVTSGSLVNGHTATFNISGTITSVGSVDNVLNSVLIKDANGNDVTSNYNIKLINGTLTIVDTTKPVCTFKGPEPRWIMSGKTAIYTLECTDLSLFDDSDVTSSDFSLSSTGVLSVSSPIKNTIDDGYSYQITVTGIDHGTVVLTLNDGVISDENGNKNNSISSEKIIVNPTLYEATDIELVDNILPDDGDERIISGDNTLNNYVWYSGKLWRIVALNNDGSVKLITENNITTIAWGANTTYKGSWIYQWLNEDFRDTLYNYENLLVTDYEWNATETTSDSKPDKTTMIGGPVGLLNAYEYTKSYRSVSRYDGYLNNDYYWWLITPDDSSCVNYVGVHANVQATEPSTVSGRSIAGGVRPSINMKNDIRIAGGVGTKDNPYTISGDIGYPNTNEVLSNRVSGEYVKFDNELYRIVNIENNITKITKVDYIRDDNNDVITKALSSGSNYGTGTDSGYWDYYLNNEWYNNISSNYRNMIVSRDWYLGTVNLINDNYKNAICKTQDTTETTANCTKTSDIYNGNVGLGRFGEMFNAQIGDESSKSEKMWMITPSEQSHTYNAWMIAPVNYLWIGTVSSKYAARPSINLNSSVTIIGGKGTEDSPFEIEFDNPITCEFTGPDKEWIVSPNTATYTLTCTSNSPFSDSTITSSDFKLSSDGVVSIGTPTKTSVSNGYRYAITVTGVNDGRTTLTLKQGAISDNKGNYNNSVTSKEIIVNPTLYEAANIDLVDNILPYDNGLKIVSGDKTLNNYVWYSGKLWRIVDVGYGVKLITQDNITSISWGENSTYEGSWIYQWLNEDFKATLYNYENLLETNSYWDASETTSIITPPQTTMVKGTVGLLNNYEYNQTCSKTSYYNGYLNNGYYWWLMTPYNSSKAWYVISNSGNMSNSLVALDAVGVRPVVNVRYDIKVAGGNGTKDNPYTIKGDISTPNANELLNNRVSGEYVNFDNELYRIVNIENNITKLTKVDYVRNNSGAVETKKFANTAIFGSGTTNDYWDYYLNNSWYNNINDNYRGMIVAGDWYIEQVSYQEVNNYKNSICATKNTTEKTSICERTSSVYNGYVGLGRYGEIFTSQINKDYGTASNIWTLTPYDTTFVRRLNSDGGFTSDYDPNVDFSTVRPSINLNSNVVITSGKGTEDSPFEITY